MFAADYHPQSNGQRHPNEHKSGTRYDGRYEDEDMVEYQLEQHGLDTLDESSNNKAIEEWLNHQDYPVQGIPELPDTESHLSGPPEYTSVTSRRSFIPVPVRRKTGLKDQPRNRRSQIPVSVKKIQKKQHIKPQSTLQVVDVSERETFVDEMELFDRITF